MPRIDDYHQALDLGKKEVLNYGLDQVAASSGAQIRTKQGGEASLSLRFMNREVEIAWPGLDFHRKGSQEALSLQEGILLLHYLHGACASGCGAVKGEWISFQEVPDGRFYLDAFQRRAKIPLVQAFGNEPDRLVRLATGFFGATLFDQGDSSVIVQALPLVPIALVLWKGDDEFPPDGTILFDRSISGILSAEDVAWLAGMVVYPLIGMAGKKG